MHKGIIDSTCALPSGLEPCSKLCKQRLGCGHMFPGVCGSDPPEVCIECVQNKRPHDPTLLLPCGHFIRATTADIAVELYYMIRRPMYIDNFRDGDLLTRKPECPFCKGSLLDSPRYFDLKEAPNMSKIIDRLLSKAGRKIASLNRRVSYHEEQLVDNFHTFCQQIRPTPLSAPSNRRMIQDRCSELAEVQQAILDTRGMSVHFFPTLVRH